MSTEPLNLPVDHVGIVGPDIDTLVIACRNLGFTVYGPEALWGRDAQGGRIDLHQQSAHIMFGDDYIELTSVSEAGPDHHLAGLLDPPYGVRLLILGADDIEASAARAVRAGFRLGAIQSATRDVHYGDGGTAEFRWCRLYHDDVSEALLGFVEHRTRERVFASPPTHANGAMRLAAIASLEPRMNDALSALATPRGLPLLRASAADLSGDFGVEATDCAPLAIVCLECHDVDATQRYFDQHGVDYLERDGRLCTMAADTGFVFLQGDRRLSAAR